ncbi:MAG: exopolysaccharide Pel transporter PelG [Spirochaetes bacterium]|nr:exopolysaccharide Pel transporter PelG [Spirochaetota bacterium]
MAGIGFELYKILRKGTLSSILKVLFLGTVIVAGPWILSVLSMYFIQKYAYNAISENPVIFTVTIVYLYAFSLIIFGGIHYIFSRYIADMMYIENDEAIPAALVSVFYIVCALSVILSVIFIWFNDFSMLSYSALYKFSLCFLFVVLNLIWLMLIYIALLKAYNRIFFSYLFGVLISIAGVYYLGRLYGVAGALFGYALGQFVIVLLLVIVAQKSYPVKNFKINNEFFSYFKDYKYLFFIGMFFNLGIWSDKIIYWFAYGTNIRNTLYYYYAEYDLPVFLAFLTMIPALIYFLVVSEPGFHKDYTKFIKNILGDTLADIRQNKKRMIKSLRRGTSQLILFQVVWTIGLSLNLKEFLAFMGYELINTTILNVLLIAVFFHVLSLTLQIFLLYLELRTEALISTVLYFTGNIIFTYIFIVLDLTVPGISYMLGALCSASYAAYHLIKKAPVIDYIIFNRR